MDFYITSYTCQNVMYGIYEYFGWATLQKYEYVPDSMWYKIYTNLCLDPKFKERINKFCKSKPKDTFGYKEQVVFYINNTIYQFSMGIFAPSVVPDILWRNWDFALYVIKAQSERGLSIQSAHNYIHHDLITNPRFIMTTLKYNTKMMEFLPASMKCDKNLILRIITTTKTPSSILSYIDTIMKSDPDIILALLQYLSKGEFYNISNILLSDRDWILKAVIIHRTIFKYISPSLQYDREYVLKLVKANGLILKYLHEDFRNDEVIAYEAIVQNPHAIKYLGNNLRVLRNNKIFAYKIYRYSDQWCLN